MWTTKLIALSIVLGGSWSLAQTNLCAGKGSQPGCVISELYGGGGGLNLPNTGHMAHFDSDFQNNFTPLSSAIATQLALLPLISPASGFTYKYDSAAGVFVRSSTSFGPIFTERAETIGRGKIYFGISYQRFRFGNLDGQDLHNLPVIFTHTPTASVYGTDFISTNNNIDLKIDQTTLFGTVGITDRLDFSVAIPIVSTRLAVTSDALINRVAGAQPGTPLPTSCTTSPVSSLQPHFFNPCDPENSTRKLFRNSGSASGIGDVVFRGKAGLIKSDVVRLAFLMDVRIPSGSARDFLGSGALGIKPFVALSLERRVSPHVNVGYQWNGKSVLAGDFLTGKKSKLPGQIFYSFGTDIGVTKRLTAAFDYLGQALFNAKRVLRQPFQSPASATFQARTLPGIAFGTDTYSLNNGAAGIKYNAFGKLLITANLLFRMDNNGLRQNVTPLIGVSYALGE